MAWSLLTGLQGLREELTTTREELSARLDQTNARLESGFDMMDRRFDQPLLGEHGQEHQQFRKRLDRLETHTGLPSLE